MESRGFSLVEVNGFRGSRGISLLGSTGLQGAQVTCGRAGLSSCGSRALECAGCSCGAWLKDLPDQGSDAIIPALASGFSSTAPLGKSSSVLKRRGGKGGDVRLHCFVFSPNPFDY